MSKECDGRNTAFNIGDQFEWERNERARNLGIFIVLGLIAVFIALGIALLLEDDPPDSMIAVQQSLEEADHLRDFFPRVELLLRTEVTENHEAIIQALETGAIRFGLIYNPTMIEALEHLRKQADRDP